MSEEPTAPPATGSDADDWQSAFAEFATTRVELIRLESRDAARTAIQKTIEALGLAGVALLAWLCLLAGIIGALQHFTDWPWWTFALLLGAIHGLIAWRFAVLLKRPGAPAFPLTRAEFTKDRLWMKSLKKQKSKL
jgi:hypothetical protein